MDRFETDQKIRCEGDVKVKNAKICQMEIYNRQEIYNKGDSPMIRPHRTTSLGCCLAQLTGAWLSQAQLLLNPQPWLSQINASDTCSAPRDWILSPLCLVM